MGLAEKQLAEEVLHSIKNGGFPDSEEVASAQLDAPSFNTLIDVLSVERENAKAEIRSLSRESAPDIDGWVMQARKLQADIERSKKTAREIIEQAEAGKAIRLGVEDAASKVRLLEKELFFNETLADSIGKIQHVVGLLDLVQDTLSRDDIPLAWENLEEANSTLAYLGSLENSRVLELLLNRSRQRRTAIESRVIELWNVFIKADPVSHRVVIKASIEGQPTVTLGIVVDALVNLNLFDSNVTRLCSLLDTSIVAHVLSRRKDESARIVAIKADEVFVSEEQVPPSVHSAIRNVKSIVSYLHERLPPPLATAISTKLAPKIDQRLVSNWLSPSLPTSIEEFEEFHKIVAELDELANDLRRMKWSRSDELKNWKKDIPNHWLAKRKEKALFAIREACIRGVAKRKRVERVETQVVSKDDIMVSGGQEDDDWDAAWGEDTEESAEQPEEQKQDEEDADADAWGFDDEEEKSEAQNSAQQDSKQQEDEEDAEDEADAWGWGEDDEDKPDSPKVTKTNTTKPKSSEQKYHSNESERELTLRETYTVTSLPDDVVKEITNMIFDAERLSGTEFSSSPLAGAATKLYTSPSLILAMYRAVASTYYVSEIAGNMLMYNDCSRLCDLLVSFLSDQSAKDKSSNLPVPKRPSTHLKLNEDVKALEGFGKRAYGKEMESQRTIVRDLLESAQNFENCTVQPFARECDNAISMTVDRIREVNNNWKDTLSHSARLQSLGSLLSTVITKMINDIEDMEDISEDQSQRLKHFCEEVSKLQDLFVQKQDDGGSRSMVGIYTPNWLKFQYLSEVMASSLADIKYMWTNEGLNLEFGPDEIIQLIKALFAESDYRRDAIKSIDRNASRW